MNNTRQRGKAFQRILNRIVKPNRRIDSDLYLFDEYTLNPLLKKPFTTDYTIVIEVTKGCGTTIVNTVPYKFEAPCLIFLLSGQMIQFITSEENPAQTRVMVMSERFMREFNSMSVRMNDIYSTLMLNPVVALDRYAAKDMGTYVSLLTSITRKTANPNRFISAKFLSTTIFYSTILDAVKINDLSSNRTAQICQRFMELVKENFRTEHSLDYYASKLCITDRYLYMTVKAVTGKTANYWLNYYLLSEAKILLRTTDLSIQEISDRLNFPAQSNFGKYFKRQTGESPINYRKTKS